MNIYLTGDRHGKLQDIELFCQKKNTSREDVLIILGDSGINYLGDLRDRGKKIFLSNLPITILAVHGNHEARPSSLPDYKEILWQNGTVYAEEEFPNLLFAKDGEIYDLCGQKCIALGGAYSIDKYMRIAYGWRWYPDEQPSDEIKQFAEEQLQKHDWNVDFVLSHTAPLKYEPVETFLSGIDQSRVDKSTEEWLNKIEDRLTYRKWFCGHYHTQKEVDRLRFMYEDFCQMEVSSSTQETT